MKKILAILLVFALLALSLIACGNTPKIQKYTWEFLSATKNDEPVVIVGKLTAKGGDLTLVDEWRNETYTGTYSGREEFSPTAADYDITLNGTKGRAVLTVGENNKGETVANLTFYLGDYTLVFVPKEK